MLRTAPWIPTAAARAVRPCWGAWLRRAWERFMLDEDSRFLGEARDLADLEGRLRRLEQGRADRFGPLPPGL
jgi:hypothetical protein